MYKEIEMPNKIKMKNIVLSLRPKLVESEERNDGKSKTSAEEVKSGEPVSINEELDEAQRKLNEAFKISENQEENKEGNEE